jgi:hypothetical protein
MNDKPLLDAYRFGTFCKRHELTPAQLKTLMRRGLGPEVMDLGTAQRISREAAERWRREREAAALAARQVA